MRLVGLTAALACFLRLLPQQASPNSDSLYTQFEKGEIDLEQRDFQAAANEFRALLNKGESPTWMQVWAHIDLGEIFDMTGQRERAVNQYRAALSVGDNTDGAQDFAMELIESQHQVAPMFHRVFSHDFLPRRTVEISAEYSPEARLAHLEGSVELAATVSADGSAHDVQVLQALGLGLDESAIAAVTLGRFEAGIIDNVSTAERIFVRVNFLLPTNTTRWHLLHFRSAAPAGIARPTFAAARYPASVGVSPGAVEDARVVGAMGREAVVSLTFDVDERGNPVHFPVNLFGPLGHPCG